MDFKKIKIKNFEKIIKTENNSSQWVPYKKNQYKSFYVEKYKDKIVIMDTKGNFYYTQLNKINSENITLNNIKKNVSVYKARDFFNT